MQENLNSFLIRRNPQAPARCGALPGRIGAGPLPGGLFVSAPIVAALPAAGLQQRPELRGLGRGSLGLGPAEELQGFGVPAQAVQGFSPEQNLVRQVLQQGQGLVRPVLSQAEPGLKELVPCPVPLGGGGEKVLFFRSLRLPQQSALSQHLPRKSAPFQGRPAPLGQAAGVGGSAFRRGPVGGGQA